MQPGSSVVREMVRLREEIERKLEQEDRAEVALLIAEAKGSYLQEGIRKGLLDLRNQRFRLEGELRQMEEKYGVASPRPGITDRLIDDAIFFATVAQLPNEVQVRAINAIEGILFGDINRVYAFIAELVGRDDIAEILNAEADKDFQWALSQVGLVDDPGTRSEAIHSLVSAALKWLEVVTGGPLGEDEDALRVLGEGFLRGEDPLADSEALSPQDRARLEKLRFYRLLLYMLLLFWSWHKVRTTRRETSVPCGFHGGGRRRRRPRRGAAAEPFPRPIARTRGPGSQHPGPASCPGTAASRPECTAEWARA